MLAFTRDMTSQLQTLAHFDLGKVGEDFLARAPWIANSLLRGALGVLSPFHRGLGVSLVRWEKRSVTAELSVRRRLRDHNGNLHAGALGLAGETMALLLLLRNIRLTKYAFELKEVSAVYHDSVKRRVSLSCELDADAFVKLRNTLQEKHLATVTLKTQIFDGPQSVAVVRTVWCVRPRKIFSVK